MAYRQLLSSGQTINERLTLDVGGSFRFGLAGIDNAQGSTRMLRQYETNLSVETRWWTYVLRQPRFTTTTEPAML